MSSKGEITPEAISLLLRLTPSIERAQELLEADVLSEYWQGVKDTVLMHNKMVLEDKEPTQITRLEEALLWLNKRTQDREKRQVEGTHTI